MVRFFAAHQAAGLFVTLPSGFDEAENTHDSSFCHRHNYFYLKYNLLLLILLGVAGCRSDLFGTLGFKLQVGITLHTHIRRKGWPTRNIWHVKPSFPTKAVAKITQAAGFCLTLAGKTLAVEWKPERRQLDRSSFISKVHPFLGMLVRKTPHESLVFLEHEHKYACILIAWPLLMGYWLCSP